jgi:pimeloyl-ACP methyl ester carboxylesterase
MSDYLLVHGGLAVGWVWDDVKCEMERSGHRVHVVDRLPSVGTDPAALGDLRADTRCVRTQLDTIDEPVVLVGHSYSGMVVAEFADHPKVRHSVYLTAFCPEHGRSALSILGDVLPSAFVRRPDGAVQLIDDFEVTWQAFCPELDRDRARLVLSRFEAQSYSSLATPSAAPDRTHPTTYVIATGETDASVAAQEAWAANTDLVVRMAADHMLQLSQPAELAELLDAI